MPRFIPLLLALAAFAGCDSAAPSPEGTLDVRYAVEGAPAQVIFAGADGLVTEATPGAWEYRFAAERGVVLSLQATSTTGAPVTAVIYVEDTPFRADRGPSVRLDAPTDGYEQGEVEVHGFIEGVGTDRVTVLGLAFVVGAQTALLDRNAQPIPFSTFKLGTFVEAEGVRRSDGLYAAEALRIEGDGDDGQIEVEGTIEALTVGSVTIAGYHFTVDEFTLCLDDDNHPIPFSTFHVGDHAEVEGYTRDDGTDYAEKLKLDA